METSSANSQGQENSITKLAKCSEVTDTNAR